MLKELSSEEIITKILVSREIINNKIKKNDKFYSTKEYYNLGDFLENSQIENFNNEENELINSNYNYQKFKKPKYSFINTNKNVKF